MRSFTKATTLFAHLTHLKRVVQKLMANLLLAEIASLSKLTSILFLGVKLDSRVLIAQNAPHGSLSISPLLSLKWNCLLPIIVHSLLKSLSGSHPERCFCHFPPSRPQASFPSG